tara:strand:+ start:356 stop:604 length:249 start_codon:yes stop_codon:yes gene_type:complete
MKKTRKVIKDYQEYLDHIYDLSGDLEEDQDKQLANMLAVQLAFLIAMKKASNLGLPSFDHFFRKEKKKSPRNTRFFDEDEDW